MLDDLTMLSEELAIETAHIANGYIAPPWEELSYIDANATSLIDELERETELKQRMKNIPWSEYHRLMKNSENLLKDVSSEEKI